METILSFIISNPKRSRPNQNIKRAAYFKVFFLPKIKIEKPDIVIIGNAIIEISNLNHNTATIQEVIVVPILAPIIAQIALPRSIKLAQTNHKTITVTTVLLCKIHVTRDPDKIPFNGVFVVLRSNLFKTTLPTCLILSEKICIPKRNILSHHNSSRQEKGCSI